MDATTNNPPVLEVRGLTKRFGGLTAVKNLSLALRALGPIGRLGLGEFLLTFSFLRFAGREVFDVQGVLLGRLLVPLALRLLVGGLGLDDRLGVAFLAAE